MIELLGSKAGVSCGRFHYGSAFGEPSGHADRVEAIRFSLLSAIVYSFLFSKWLWFRTKRNGCCFKQKGMVMVSIRPFTSIHYHLKYLNLSYSSETLVKHGFSYNGKDFLYSGLFRTLFFFSFARILQFFVWYTKDYQQLILLTRPCLFNGSIKDLVVPKLLLLCRNCLLCRIPLRVLIYGFV